MASPRERDGREMQPIKAKHRAGIAACLSLALMCPWKSDARPAGAIEERPVREVSGEPWTRHVIDDSSRGADGVRLEDVNGDGLADIATPWEEGGLVRIYLNPGATRAKEKWPAVTAGRVASPEDAVFADLDGDGAFDVVSSCEGSTRTMYVHWAPRDPSRYLDESAWRTEPIPATAGKQMWMFALPLQVDGAGGLDLVAGSKGEGGAIGWLQSPAEPRDLSAWRYRKLRDAGWIMSLIARDLDGDGHLDVLFSDRTGPRRGVGWLKNPGPAAAAAGAPWAERMVGATDREVMFCSLLPLEGAGVAAIFAAVKRDRVMRFELPAPAGEPAALAYTFPLERFGGAKAVRAATLFGGGKDHLVVTCEGAVPPRSGVFALPLAGGPAIDISGPAGVKFDLVELLDLDGDGDLDVLTCEETENLGVIWYENPGAETSRG
jgi:hypothetical protein